MATKYANFDIASRPGSAGAVADPYGLTEWLADSVLGVAHTYYLRGSAVLGAPLDFGAGGGHTLRAWDIDLYGPWRIYAGVHTFTPRGGYWYDGIAEGNYIRSLNTCVRCYVRNTGAGQEVGVSAVLNDSLLVANAEMASSWAFVRDYERNILVLQDATEGFDNNAPTAITFINNITNKANFAAMAINNGAAPADGGGNLYGVDFDPLLPTWDSADLQDFNIFPLRGVGAPGSWACPAPLYVNLLNAYDDTFPRKGTTAQPLDFNDLTDRLFDGVAPEAVGDERVNIYGTRDGRADAGYTWNSNGAVVDGWDGTAAAKKRFWGIVSVPGSVFGLSNGVLDYRRGFFNEGAFFIHNTSADFYGCGFINTVTAAGVTINAWDPGAVVNMNGCTIKTNKLWLSDVGAGAFFNLNYCLIDTPLLHVDATAATVFYKCRFTASRASILADLPFAPIVTFAECEFEVDLIREIPPVIDLTEETLLYWRYGVWLTETITAADVAYWTTNNFNEGLGGSARGGVGAFYFSTVDPKMTASPESGTAPLEVQFGCNATDSVEVLFEFGDGEVSDEINPLHTYSMPGEYIVILTFTDPLGGTSVVTITIYVYEFDYTDPEGMHVSFSDVAYRHAVKPAEGIGICEWGGPGMPWPAAYTGTARGYDKRNRAIALVMDNRSAQLFRVGIPEQWTDQDGEYGGVDIPCRARLPEWVARGGEHKDFEHVENHAHVRPWSEDYRGQDGFDSRGYLEGFEVDEKIFVDGEQNTPKAKLQDLPRVGDYVFRNKVEGNRLQLELLTNASNFRLISVQAMMAEDDAQTGPGTDYPVENQWQDEFANVDFRLARDSLTPMLERVTGVGMGGSYDTLVPGPDGYATSAMSYGIANGLTGSIPMSDGDSTFIVWLSQIVSAMSTIFAALDDDGDVVQFRIDQDTGGLTLIIMGNGMVDAEIPLRSDGSSWFMLALVQDGNDLRVYENGIQTDRVGGGILKRYGGTVAIPSASVLSMYSPRRVTSAIGANALAYYYDDVVSNEANGGLEPVMR